MVKARDGDRVAYEQLYCRYFRTVVSFLARHTDRGQACEDLAQEVFTRVWRHRSRYQPLAPVKRYLLRIAVNVLREDRAKSHGPVPTDIRNLETVADARQPSPPAQVQSAEQLQAIRALMASLPVQQRRAVELVYLAGLDPDEAARRLGCSVKALRVHLCRARLKLRSLTRVSQQRADRRTACLRPSSP